MGVTPLAKHLLIPSFHLEKLPIVDFPSPQFYFRYWTTILSYNIPKNIIFSCNHRSCTIFRTLIANFILLAKSCWIFLRIFLLHHPMKKLQQNFHPFPWGYCSQKLKPFQKSCQLYQKCINTSLWKDKKKWKRTCKEQMWCDQYCQIWWRWITSGLILESEGVGAIFQKKGKAMLKKGKIFENCTKFENIFKKGRWLHTIIARNKLLE